MGFAATGPSLGASPGGNMASSPDAWGPALGAGPSRAAASPSAWGARTAALSAQSLKTDLST